MPTFHIVRSRGDNPGLQDDGGAQGFLLKCHTAWGQRPLMAVPSASLSEGYAPKLLMDTVMVRWPIESTDVAALSAAIRRFCELVDQTDLRNNYSQLRERGIPPAFAARLALLGPVWQDMFFANKAQLPSLPQQTQKELIAEFEGPSLTTPP